MRFIVFITIFIAACSHPKTGEVLSADESTGECPYLTTDEQGNTILSWVRLNTDSTTSFCYAKWDDNKFGIPVTIPNTENIQPHGENLPRILFKPNGEIIALFGSRSTTSKNKYAGMVSYVQSFDNGNTWSVPKTLVDDSAGHDQRYYDVSVLPNGEAGIIWLDDRKSTTLEGSALYFASTKGREGFCNERLISESCCQCCRTDLYVDKKGGIHCLYRGIIQDSIRDMMHIVSTDGGKTFTSPSRISADNWVIRGCPHTGPSVSENEEGLQFAWYTGQSKGSYYCSSADNGKTFTRRSNISVSGSHPQITTLNDGSIVIVWDEFLPGGSEGAKRIGLQRRDANGRTISTEYITGDLGKASYPVLSSLGKDHFVVAFTDNAEKNKRVMYKVVEYQD